MGKKLTGFDYSRLLFYLVTVKCHAGRQEGRYAEVTGCREEVFEARWHDWIVAAEGQLAAFTRYIRENPRRAWLRWENHRFFLRARRVAFAGMRALAVARLASAWVWLAWLRLRVLRITMKSFEGEKGICFHC